MFLIMLTTATTMAMKISLFDINHLSTLIGENTVEQNNVVKEQ